MNIRKKYWYIRVSSKSQESNSSIEYQTKELKTNGIPEKNIRVEIGSATDSIKDRPIFEGNKTWSMLQKYFKFFKTARQTY